SKADFPFSQKARDQYESDEFAVNSGFDILRKVHFEVSTKPIQKAERKAAKKKDHGGSGAAAPAAILESADLMPATAVSTEVPSAPKSETLPAMADGCSADQEKEIAQYMAE